ARYHQRPLPPLQRQQPPEDRCQCGAQHAHRQAERGEDAGEPGNVEGPGHCGALRRCCCGAPYPGRRVVDQRIIPAGSEFLDLLGYQAGDSAVRRPERFPDTDCVLYHLDHGSVPVVALAIVEQTIAADHELAFISCCHCCDDVQRLALADRLTATGTGTVQQEALAVGRHLAVGIHIPDLDHQIATAPVYIEAARLEHRLVPAAVEILKGNEIAQQWYQTPLQPQQPVQIDQSAGRLRYLHIPGHEGQQSALIISLHQLGDTLHGQVLEDTHLGLGCLPGEVCV